MQRTQQKIKESEYERQAKELLSLRGMLKGKVKPMTDEENADLRREAGKEFFIKMERKINQK